MKRFSIPTFVLAAAAAVATASPPQRVEGPILSIRTDLVTLPVTVIDRQGALVGGLRREHFSVYEDGRPQAIEFFTSEEAPATIGLLIDSSGSMRGHRAAVTLAASAFAAMRHPLDEFFTLNFNEMVWPGLPPPVMFTEDMEELDTALAAAPAEGMTALYDAVDRGLDHLQLGARDRKALIVVSDGGDNASTQALDAVVERARRSTAVIYSVTFPDRDNRDARPQVLKRLARETGGRAFMPKQAADVNAAFARIAGEIRSGYTIGFTPAEVSTPGFRAIRVVADAGDGRPLIVRTRAGYHAGGSNPADQ
jgi:Ca-activated chloride channel family protein